MRYRLDYVSPWTAYTVGWYSTFDLCERDIVERFDIDWIEFRRDKDGVLKLTLSIQDNTVLELYEVEG